MNTSHVWTVVGWGERDLINNGGSVLLLNKASADVVQEGDRMYRGTLECLRKEECTQFVPSVI